MLAEGAGAESLELDLVKSGCDVSRSRNEVLAAGGGILVSTEAIERVFAGTVAEAGAGLPGAPETGRVDRSLAGVLAFEALGTFVVPLVMRVNSASSPLLS